MKTLEERAMLRELRDIRRQGSAEPLALVAVSLMADKNSQIARQDMDYKNMYNCILGMLAGKSACEWCYDHAECLSKSKCSGCKDWMLRDPTEDEERLIQQRVSLEMNGGEPNGK